MINEFFSKIKFSSYYNLILLLIIVPIVIIIYNLVPKKIRPYILLLSNILFFSSLSLGLGKKRYLGIFIIVSVITIYLVGIILDKINKKRDNILDSCEKDDKKEIKKKYQRKKLFILILGIIINLSFLVFFKYLNFFGSIFVSDFTSLKIIAPIGISFYTLEAISYMIDIYHDKVSADYNFFRVLLYLTFFPKLMEGPISRYSELKDTLYEGIKVNYHNFCYGYQRIFYGILKKVVIADRLNVLVKLIFNNYSSYTGGTSLIAVISYTIMLYMEFSGTIDVVLGISEIFGIKLPENFRQPFFAKNISEFWTRWHISLGLWFKDYIYYPISLTKPMKKLTLFMRKKIGNHYGPLFGGSIVLLMVWFLNGLWHGAGYTYLFFGLYHFIMILSGSIIEPLVKYICNKLHINRLNIFYRIMQSIKMTLFVLIGELFFRANSLKDAFLMLKRIFINFKFNGRELLSIGLDINDYLIIVITLIIVFIISLMKEKMINVRDAISKKHIVIRWALYYALIIYSLIFGAYGSSYVPVEPIYADF